MRQIQMSGVTVVCILVGWVLSAHASTIMYTNQSAWKAEVLGSGYAGYSLTSIDFENTTKADPYTVTAADVIFASPDVSLEVREDYGVPYGSGKVLYPAFNQPLQIELPSSVYAFGFDLGELGPILGYDATATLSNVVLSTGDAFAGPYAGNPFPSFAFFGFCSDLPITSLSMWPRALVEPILDNFIYARAPIPSPEPSSLLLLSSGLFGLVANAWRNRRRQEG